MRLPLIAVVSCGIAFCQQLAFTSRVYVQSPVVMSSILGSKEFGFDSVVLRNDAAVMISAVHFKIAVRAVTDTAGDEEVADERRVAVNLDPRDSKRVVIGLGQVEGLRQLARSRKRDASLVILTIEAVEFEGGAEWRQTVQEGSVPPDPRTPRK
jgi:hypothetical protein